VRTGFNVYVIVFDPDVFGIFASREAAEAEFERQINEGGPAWPDCKVEAWFVEGEPEREERAD
jgi:hypothetical protein